MGSGENNRSPMAGPGTVSRDTSYGKNWCCDSHSHTKAHGDGLKFKVNWLVFILNLYSMYSHLYCLYFLCTSCTPRCTPPCLANSNVYSTYTVRVQSEYNVLYSAHEITRHFHRVHGASWSTEYTIKYIPEYTNNTYQSTVLRSPKEYYQSTTRVTLGLWSLL